MSFSAGVRWFVFLALAAIFFVMAINSAIYELTSPTSLSWHVVLRKAYSIVAFALVGGTFVYASGASLRTATVVVAVYSGLIEIGQHYISHSPEGPYWNAFDVGCGAVGGALGWRVLRALSPWVRAK